MNVPVQTTERGVAARSAWPSPASPAPSASVAPAFAVSVVPSLADPLPVAVSVALGVDFPLNNAPTLK